jgi:quercetin dioxygenase-like cupin family protein
MKPDQSDAESLALLDALAPALDPISPPQARHAAMSQHLAVRICDSVAKHAAVRVHRRGHGDWQRVKTGVDMKLLHRGAVGNSILVRLAAGASLPVHRHRWAEEGIVLEGAVFIGAEKLEPGDYHLSLPGSRHARITSAQGGIAFLRGASLGGHGALLELLGGLVPHRGPPPVTRPLGQGAWTHLAPGVEQHVVRDEGGKASRLIRMLPGAKASVHANNQEQECVMIAGDAFFGDLLVCAGDFYLAPMGNSQDIVESENGALFFVHGASDA